MKTEKQNNFFLNKGIKHLFKIQGKNMNTQVVLKILLKETTLQTNRYEIRNFSK